MKTVINIFIVIISLTGYSQGNTFEQLDNVMTKQEVLDLNSLFEKKRNNFDFQEKKGG